LRLFWSQMFSDIVHWEKSWGKIPNLTKKYSFWEHFRKNTDFFPKCSHNFSQRSVLPGKAGLVWLWFVLIRHRQSLLLHQGTLLHHFMFTVYVLILAKMECKIIYAFINARNIKLGFSPISMSWFLKHVTQHTRKQFVAEPILFKLNTICYSIIWQSVIQC